MLVHYDYLVSCTSPEIGAHAHFPKHELERGPILAGGAVVRQRRARFLADPSCVSNIVPKEMLANGGNGHRFRDFSPFAAVAADSPQIPCMSFLFFAR